MLLFFAILPVALLIALMTVRCAPLRLPMPAHAALPAAALVAYAAAMTLFAPAGGATRHARLTHAAVIDGLLSSLTPLGIVFGAIVLFKTLEHSGAMRVLTARLRALSPDPVAQLMLVAWAFSFLVEGLSGFGTPAALAAPVLVGLGFPALRVAAVCLVLNTVPVSFGAVGTPTWFGLGELNLSGDEIADIGRRTAIIHAAAAPLIVPAGLLLVTSWREVRCRLWFVLLSVSACVVPYLVTAFFSVEFPSIVGGVCGIVSTAALAGARIGLPRATGAAAVPAPDAPRHAPAPLTLLRASAPLAATVLLLAVTRIEPLGLKSLLTADSPAAAITLGPLGEAWVSAPLVVGLRDILGTQTSWRMPLLYVPFILPFVAVSLLSVPLLRMPARAVRDAWRQTFARLARPALALAGAMVLVKLMMLGGEASPSMRIGRAMADAAGGAWPSLAPLLGALGSFFAGSNSVSNLTFGPIQASIAEQLGLHTPTILALQSAGGALGNMICVHNIVAVAAVLGLTQARHPPGEDNGPDTSPGGEVASVLRLTAGPCALYALVAAAVAWVLLLFP
ncbi:MAG: L-lactate permease [Phycisphaeraceae bacterium]|nr:L-lactate permease [Phycisphaeraceae bacterium]